MMLQHLKDVITGKAPIGKKRSARWAGVRKAFLAKNPRCAVCGGTQKLEAHHIQPFHLKPELELEPSNLIALCEAKKNGVNCHQFAGHLGSFRSINTSVVADAAAWNAKLRARP
jgi:hypothetical protein